MNFSNSILMVLLLSVIASATNTELSNNTNFCLLILLCLAQNPCNTGCWNNGCNNCCPTCG